jgi:hypothetical protein
MKKVQSGEPLVVGEVTITPMERVERHLTSDKRGFFVYCSKKPVRVTVDSPQGSWDFDLEDWDSEAELGLD